MGSAYTAAFAQALQIHQGHIASVVSVGAPAAYVGVSVAQMHGMSRHLSLASKSAVQWRRQTCRGAAAADRLRMQEKKADVFETATVLSNTEACEGMRLLKLKVPPAIAASYTVGGQYVKARADEEQEKPNYYAMCSAPGSSSDTADTFEFLIKRTSAHDWSPGSGWVCDLAEGDALANLDTFAQSPARRNPFLLSGVTIFGFEGVVGNLL